MNSLFVYGTLRPGCCNGYASQLAVEARHVGRGRIAGRLFRLTNYPALAEKLTDDDWVIGDLYDGVPDGLMKQLDEYEGLEYSRETTQVILESGIDAQAFVYRYVMPLDGVEVIPSGDWSLYARESSAPE